MTERIGNWLLDRMTPQDSLTLVYWIIGIAALMCCIAVIRGGYGVAQLTSLSARKRRKSRDSVSETGRSELLELASRETGNPYQAPLHD